MAIKFCLCSKFVLVGRMFRIINIHFHFPKICKVGQGMLEDEARRVSSLLKGLLSYQCV